MSSVRELTPATGVSRGGSTVFSRDGGAAGLYYADIGPRRGPLIYNDALIAIRVNKTRRSRTTIGAALCAGRDATGVALWELTIGNVEIPDRWIVIDREFRRTESAPGSAFAHSRALARPPSPMTHSV